jgi:hypothetical protein
LQFYGDIFRPGLRQGKYGSPVLFVLCLEKFSHMIISKVVEKEWKPLSVSKEGPSLSHVFFADDLMLFGEASKKQIRVMLACLKAFSTFSGFYNPKTAPSVAAALKEDSSIPLTNGTLIQDSKQSSSTPSPSTAPDSEAS